MDNADRHKYALRVLLWTFVFAALFVFGWAEAFGVDDEREPLRLVFWSVLLACFAGAIALSFTFVRSRLVAGGALLALLIGAVAGIVFTVIAQFPAGLAPGASLTPVHILWPLATTLAYLLAAVARYDSADAADYTLYHVRPGGLLLAIAVIITSKAALDRIGEPMNFARARAPMRAAPLDSLRRHAQAAAGAQSCADSLKWRSVTDPDVAIDSTLVLERFGVFVDANFVDAPVEKRGRMLHLWRLGDRYFGVSEVYAGATPVRGWLEAAHLDARGRLVFHVPFADGWADRFQGVLSERGPMGWFTTGDQRCMSRRLNHTPVSFLRDDARSKEQYISPSLRDLRRRYSNIYVRGVRPSYPAATVRETHYQITVADRPYLAPPHSAVVVTAHFRNDEQLRRVLDPQFLIDVTTNLTLQQVMVTQALDHARLLASWIVALPQESAYVYRQRLEQLRLDGSINYLSTQLAPLHEVMQ